ncbi:30S ribosomal protein S1 [Acidiluteibacter ferrifornacis]|uniref:Small ribosomal subunit protein bS1 n=1 Tax=Acidiluteibacter ferrifornacis TaxID=2692424 RepID=A0A6N9NI63_9FLAO|nr:30S ribosomal protein S1 [Acidiluteibacter ferrifornacis]MBR9833346.1 30S ribosomal protein S1 [bacterium]NBG65522.1 30S ribosomal protein S1 [Acidiluteibacter ferrifornacis]
MSENKEKDTNPAEEIVNKAKEVATNAVEAVKDAAEAVVEAVEDATSEESNEPKADNSINASVAADSKDFDWDSIGKYDELYSKAEREKMEEVYGDTLTSINEQEVLDGIIVSKNTREAVVNIGYKSDGVIPMSELRYKDEVKVGDSVEVFIESQEDKNGQLLLSHKKARALRAWDRVNDALESQEVIKGYVKCRTKGGLIVDVFGIEAFLPGSQIDVKPIRDYDMYVDKTMEFKVVKINKEFKNVVVSHKALIEAELEVQKKEIIAQLEKGQVLEGTVKNITSYGVFIDLGGVDGLVHITDLSWGRVNHPEEIVELDQKVNVVILDFDDDKKRIALGMKQLEKHPWDELDEKLTVGDKVKGKVVVVADYGAFVEIQPGVEGLIHVSEITWSNHLKPAQEFFTVGDEVEAQILTLDREERKMSLGVKQLTPDPWEGIVEKFIVGDKHKGKVTNISDFGVFVELEEGVDGLVHISDLSWSKKINHPKEVTAVGDELEVVILEVDRENRRLSLGHKQLEENPWETFETIFEVGSIHQGTITEINAKGATVVLPYGVEALATKKNIVKEDNTTAAVDEVLDFKIVDFNKNARKIAVSHTQIFKDAEFEEVKEKRASAKAEHAQTAKKIKTMQDSQEKTTLGDLDALSKLKSEMEKGEKK